jgi:hypothetical protein
MYLSYEHIESHPMGGSWLPRMSRNIYTLEIIDIYKDGYVYAVRAPLVKAEKRKGKEIRNEMFAHLDG